MKKQNAAAKRNASSKNASESAKVAIRQLPTGVRGLDEILGGGIPEFSFNIIAGTPGCGKTTLAHQLVFANATAAKPALYFTVLGEPAMKMLRYHSYFPTLVEPGWQHLKYFHKIFLQKTPEIIRSFFVRIIS